MITSDAIVIPDTGSLEQPIVPASRAETITNSNDKTNVKIPPSKATTTDPEIIKPAIKMAITEANKAINPNAFLSSVVLFRALSTFLIEVQITGINGNLDFD